MERITFNETIPNWTCREDLDTQKIITYIENCPTGVSTSQSFTRKSHGLSREGGSGLPLALQPSRTIIHCEKEFPNHLSALASISHQLTDFIVIQTRVHQNNLSQNSFSASVFSCIKIFQINHLGVRGVIKVASHMYFWKLMKIPQLFNNVLEELVLSILDFSSF